MSFSSKMKNELVTQSVGRRHCQLAELAAMTAVLGRYVVGEGGEKCLRIVTENEFVARKYFTLATKSLKVYIVASVRQSRRNGKRAAEGVRGSKTYILTLEGPGVSEALSALKLTDPLSGVMDERLCKSSCCMRAALRGYFLSCGSMSDPEKGYHLELAAQSRPEAEQIRTLMQGFSLEGKVTERKNHFVVYLKEGEGIADFLKVVDASASLLAFENTRIYKDMRGRVNRKVNCEAANISKTVAAASRQAEDIRLIDRMMGLEKLPPALRQIAGLRMEMPEASLEELGQLADPPVGKSGVNHRRRKLSEMAERLRGNM